MSPEHGVYQVVGSFWKSVQANSGYYSFWVTVMVLTVLPVCWVGWELRGIRRALEALGQK